MKIIRRKGDFKWTSILEYVTVIIVISIFAIILIGNILQISVSLNRNTDQRQASLLAEDVLASSQLDVTEPIQRIGVFSSSKLSISCKDLKIKYTNAAIIYGIEITDLTTKEVWKICPSSGNKKIVFPASVYYSETSVNPAILVITYG